MKRRSPDKAAKTQRSWRREPWRRSPLNPLLEEGRAATAQSRGPARKSKMKGPASSQAAAPTLEPTPSRTPAARSPGQRTTPLSRTLKCEEHIASSDEAAGAMSLKVAARIIVAAKEAIAGHDGLRV